MRVTQQEASILDALKRGRDPNVFFKDVLGIDTNPAQRRWLSLLLAFNGWGWLNRRILHVAANQIGKTLGLGGIILWACWYKIGTDPSLDEKWYGSPYQWLHLAPSQNQAYLTLNDIRLLLKGTHPSQVRPCLLPKDTIHEIKVETYYDGLTFWNGAIVQFRTSEDKAKAIQGRRAAGISMDECAFEDYLKEILNTALLMRLASTGGPFIGVSTPNGINDWFELVQEVIDDTETRPVAFEGHPLLGGSAHPNEPLPIWQSGDGYALLWSTVEDNIGFGILAETADRMEKDLDESTKEQQLRGAFLEPAEAYFSPSKYVIAAFVDIPDHELPQPGHSYVISWDPSMSSDPTVAVVLDVTKKPWRGVEFKYWAKPRGEDALLNEMYALHALYNGGGMRIRPGQKRPAAITVYDETSMGGAMLKSALTGLHPKRGINLAGPTMKLKLLTNARAALSQGIVKLPKGWYQLQRELLNYRIPDTKIKQDSVMAFVQGAEVAARGFTGQQAVAFSPTATIYRNTRK